MEELDGPDELHGLKMWEKMEVLKGLGGLDRLETAESADRGIHPWKCA